MKKTFIILIGATLLFSCSSNYPKCDDEKVKAEVIKKVKNKIEGDFNFGFMLLNSKHDKYRDTLYNQELILEGIRMDDINKEVNKCDCSAEVPYINFSFDRKRYFNDIQKISYTVQYTVDGELYVKVYYKW